MKVGLIHQPKLSPEKLLEEMDLRLPLVPGGDGETVSEILRGYSNGNYSIITYWKTKHPWFEIKYNKLMNRTRYIVKEDKQVSKQFLNDFIELFKKTKGKRSAAAKKLGKSWSWFRRRLDPEDKFYDRGFAEKYDYACQDVEALFSDRLHEKAFQNDVPGETRVLLHLHDRYSGLKEKEEQVVQARKVDLIIKDVVEELQLTGKVVEVK